MLRLFTLLLLATTTVYAQTEEQRVINIITEANRAGLILNADFATNPTSSVGGTINWQWLQSDSRDSTADQTAHQGLAKFNGASTNWIDLSVATGPQSCGRTLPLFGGEGFGHSMNPPRPGVTYEMVVKFDAVSNWAKPFDFGTGPGVDEMTWTWDGDNDNLGRFLIEQYVNASRVSIDFDKGAMEFFRPNLGEWYHLVQVQVPNPSAGNGAGIWYNYINGYKIPLADRITAGAAFTSLQSANYPLRINRPNQYLARSQWSADPYMQMTLDAMRVYDFALTDAQITSLAQMYSTYNNRYVPKTPGDNQNFPASAEESKWRLPSIGFDPVFHLDFATNPASVVGGSTAWQWLADDSTDTPEERAKHTGLAKFNGAATEFIDLMANTGPQSSGKVIPTLFTDSPGTGDARGWTIEMVVKPLAIQTWSKYFCLGSGPYYDAIYTGWIGGDNLWEAASYNNIRDALRPFNPGQLTFYRAPTLNKWHHLTWVLKPNATGTTTPLANYAATWELYVDGQLVSRSSTSTNYPLPLVRRQSYLALSNWNADAPARMIVDAFRVWDRALNADQVEALSDSYGITALDGGDLAWDQVMTRNNWRRPTYNLDFQTNPTQNAGSAPISWIWSEQDTTDSTVVAGQHTGLAIFNGASGSWIDLNARTGPNRVPDNLALPSFGGPTTPGGSLAPGWSVEVIVKFANWAGWSKIFVLSNGADRDETIMGFDGSADDTPDTISNNLIVQNYIDDDASPWNYAATEIVKPIVIGKWYHIILTMKPGSVDGAGNWQVYVNGQLQNWADRLLPLHTFVELQGASYPRGVPRPNSYLGRSTWNDPLSRMVIDAFRIYDYCITQDQATAFAQAYGTQVVVPVPTPANNVNFPDSPEASNWQNAGLPRAPIFNAVFSVNPASYVGGRTDYQWLEFDEVDNVNDRQFHRGLLVFNGSDPCYADLNLFTGPKSIGLIMPIIGGVGSGQGQARGMTIELVVKLTAVETWAKLIQMGSGPDLDSFVIGWNNDRYNTIEVHNFNRIRPGLQRLGAVDLMNQPPLNEWLFITLVMRLTDDGTYAGDWVAYESGNVIARKASTDAVNAANFPLPLYREYNYIAKSQWNDPTATMLLDMYRVYDYAFTEAQVLASAGVYHMTGATRPPPPVTNFSLSWDHTDESRAAARAVSKEPVFNAWFPVNPLTKVESPRGLDYVWLANDPTDSQRDQGFHRGLIQLTGAENCFVDVNTNAGPNSVGVVAPIIGGPGSGTGETVGWSFELVFKVTVMTSWVKLFNFGNGPELNNILLGVDGTDSSTMAFEIFDRTQPAWPHGFAEVFQPELNRWYHVVVQVVPTANTTSGAGVWYFWVNGRKLTYSDALWTGSSFTPIQGANYPKAIQRRNSFIGKSNWNDPTFRGLLDAFRIFDYKLSATEIQALAEAYNLNDGAYSLGNPADNKPVNPAGNAEVTAWNRESIPEPVFNANFAVDPRPIIGGALSSFDYTWLAEDRNDTDAMRSVHKGLIYIDGTVNQYIDLTRTTGRNSIGLALPTLFKDNRGYGATRGWTVELVTKLHRQEIWSKLINFATGGNDWMDSWAITWNGNDDARNRWSIQNYLNLNPVNGQPAELGFADFLRSPVLDKWYHLVVVMQPHGPEDRFAARWKIYVDGSLVLNADYNMPLPVIRENSYIGASQWGSQDNKCRMTVDALRIYDRGLTTAQVQSLARMYSINPEPSTVQETAVPDLLPPLDPNAYGGGPLPGTDGVPGTSTSSSSKLSGGAIAGIVIGSVVGAAILCVILFCVCAGGNQFGSASKSHSADNNAMKGNVGYGQMEASRAGEDEIEMGETSETA